jgi:hypothetical protein
LGNRLGSLRSACELDNAIHPSACFLGEGGVEEIALAMNAALDRAGNDSFFGLWDSGIAKGGDDLLAREPFAIAIGMNELNEARAADDFCSKKHLLNRIAKKKSPVNQKAQKLGTTTQNKNLCSCYSITYINPMDKRTKLFQIFEKLGLNVNNQFLPPQQQTSFLKAGTNESDS